MPWKLHFAFTCNSLLAFTVHPCFRHSSRQGLIRILADRGCYLHKEEKANFKPVRDREQSIIEVTNPIHGLQTWTAIINANPPSAYTKHVYLTSML
jgi:hypothetical protein